MASKLTMVIGASTDPERYANMAIRKLKAYQHPVIALGKKAGYIDDTLIETEQKPFEGVDTVSLYLNPLHQQHYYDYILSLHPRRIIFNPGTENEAFYALARAAGIKAQEACTLVLLSTGQY